MKKKKRKTLILLVIICFVIPFLLSVLVAYLIFGNPVSALVKMFELRGQPNKTSEAVTSLSYIWTLLITVYGIAITAVFSFLVWQVSERGLQVSNDIKHLEESRDSELVREQALIVYYDIQRGITYLRDLYISTVIDKDSANPKRLYFSNDWIKNVATLRNNISSENLAKIFDIYNDFFTIQSLLDSQTDQEIRKQEISDLIESVAKKMFADFVPLPLLKHFREAPPDDLLDIDLYILLQQIYLVTFPSNQIIKETISAHSYLIKVKGINYYKVKNGKPFDGEGILYTPFGYEKANGHFAFEKFATGHVNGYSNTDTNLYSVKYETTSSKRNLLSILILDFNGTNINEQHFMNGAYLNGKIHTGITTFYTSEGIITYRGKVVNLMKEGEGSTFDSSTGKILFQGTYKEGQKNKGTLYDDNIEVFSGEFRNNRPWKGCAKKLSITHSMVLSFTGDIYEGKPLNGKGYRFRINDRGETYEELKDLEVHYEETMENYDEDPEYMCYEYNNRMRMEYRHWDEYILSDWIDGAPSAREDIECNLEIIGYY